MTVAPDAAGARLARRLPARGRRAARRAREHPTSAERVRRDRRPRRRRRPDAGHRRRGRGRRLRRARRACTTRARASPSSPRSAAIVDFGDPGPARRRRPDRRLAQRQARPAAPRALDRGRRRPDDGRRRLRLRLRLRPRRGVARRPRRRRVARRRRARRPPPERRRRTGSSRSSPSSPPTRAGSRPRPRRCSRTSRPRARARARSRSRCARSPPAASTGWPRSGVPRRRRRRRPARSCARAAASSPSPALDDPLARARWTSSRTPPWSPPRTAGALASCAAAPRADDSTGARRARRRGLGRSRRRRHDLPGRPRRPRPRGRGGDRRLHRPRPPAPLPPRRGRRPRRRGSRANLRRCARRSTRWTERRTGARGRAGAAARRRRRRCWPARSAASSATCRARVLGQYEVALLDAERRRPRLLLVAPNLRERGGELDAAASDLLDWVTVHEVTHAVQFSARAVAAPAPRRPAAASCSPRPRSASTPRGSLRLPDARRPRARCGTALRDGGLVGAGRRPGARGRCSTACRRRWRSSRATPSTSMDAAGRRCCRSLPRCARRSTARRAERPPLAALLERLLGLELKLRQYHDGKRFCDAVVEQGGIAALNRALDGARAAADARRSSRDPARLARAARARARAARGVLRRRDAPPAVYTVDARLH